MGRKAIDFDRQYGNLKIICEVEPSTFYNGTTKRMVQVLCNCGNTAVKALTYLRSGETKYCGKCTKPSHHTKDLTGLRFGKLVAIKPTGEKKFKVNLWECKCDCGKSHVASVNSLTTGATKSCGCLQHLGNPKDISGQRFGRLLAVRRLELSENKDYRWLCQCDCGNTAEATIGSLGCGHTKSCGCLLRESITTHGMTGTPTYVSYTKMLSRTRYEEYSQNYSDVVVCDRWNIEKGGSFEAFFEDMGERPEGMTLNRIHGAKIYSKETCEWTTLSVQSYDQRMNSSNKSGRTGVMWRKERNVWESRITVNKTIYILYYGDSFEDACKAREEAELKYYGFTKK